MIIILARCSDILLSVSVYCLQFRLPYYVYIATAHIINLKKDNISLGPETFTLYMAIFLYVLLLITEKIFSFIYFQVKIGVGFETCFG